MLRSVYRYAPDHVVETLRKFAGLPLCAADHCEGFVTFDALLVGARRKAAARGLRLPLTNLDEVDNAIVPGDLP